MICLDVGPGMNVSYGDSDESNMEFARQFLLMALQRKVSLQLEEMQK